MACNKIANKIFSVAFPEDGSFFVTAGTQHLKIWNYADSQGIKKSEKLYKVVIVICS